VYDELLHYTGNEAAAAAEIASNDQGVKNSMENSENGILSRKNVFPRGNSQSTTPLKNVT
jgi:hypothetical protein